MSRLGSAWSPRTGGRRSFVIAAWFVPIILLTGCGSKTDANEANFKAVIAEQIRDSRCQTLPISDVRLTKEPSGVSTLPILRNAEYEGRIGAGDDAPLKELVAAGLFTRELRTMPAISGTGGHSEPTQLAVYTPTAKGQPVIRTVRGKTSAGKLHEYPAVCRADSDLVSIDNFTKPADAFGVTMSVISYTSAPKQSAEQKNLFPLSGSAAATRQKKMTLFLTDKGWVTQEEAGF